MRVAITGGTGFIGRHLARALSAEGHEVVLVARGHDTRDRTTRHLPGVVFAAVGLDDTAGLERVFAGCEAVAHCAGINREIGEQTYRRVHVEGTRHVIEAAQRAGVRRIALMSFLRARPDCGAGYHESKWAAEEIVRGSGLDYTVLKPGMIYGPGDHMLDHLSHAFHTFPIFLLVGLRDRPARPIAVQDMVRILVASLVEGRLRNQTVAVLGPERLSLGEVVRRVARAVGREPLFLPAPISLHHLLARVCERLMHVPLIAQAQVRILREGVQPVLAPDPLPADLEPVQRLTPEIIRAGLPAPSPFGLSALRCCSRPGTATG